MRIQHFRIKLHLIKLFGFTIRIYCVIQLSLIFMTFPPLQERQVKLMDDFSLEIVEWTFISQ